MPARARAPRTILVTGTDTGVGKTIASAWLAASLAPLRRVALLKAVQTGADDPAIDGDEALYRRALAAIEPMPTIETLETLPEPLAPSIAARRAGRPIDPTSLAERCLDRAAKHDITLIEGAGGLLVTIADGFDMADLAAAVGAALVVVARPSLGTLNHTLLTLEAAERRGLPVELLVVSGYPADASTVERENLRFLREHRPELPLVVLAHADLEDTRPLDGLQPRLIGPCPALLEGAGVAEATLGDFEV